MKGNRYLAFLQGSRKCQNMIAMAMHPALGGQANKMRAPARLSHLITKFLKSGHLCQAAIATGLGKTRQILQDNPPRPNGHMPDL